MVTKENRVLGSGIIKHHILNTNLMRNGADYAVYINTEQEYNGCDSGAMPDEAVSWGKETKKGGYVQCYCDATIALPIISHTLAERIASKRDGRQLCLQFK